MLGQDRMIGKKVLVKERMIEEKGVGYEQMFKKKVEKEKVVKKEGGV